MWTMYTDQVPEPEPVAPTPRQTVAQASEQEPVWEYEEEPTATVPKQGLPMTPQLVIGAVIFVALSGVATSGLGLPLALGFCWWICSKEGNG